MRKLIAVILVVSMILGANGSLAFATSSTGSAKSAAISFSDVKSSHWANSVVTSLGERGVLQGYEDGSFRPDGLVTRAEFVKMVVTFLKLNVNPVSKSSFTDIANGYWAKDTIEAARTNKIIGGYTDNTFKPLKNIKRSEIARIIVAANNKIAASSGKTASKYTPFSDIKGNWAEKDIIKLRTIGIADAYPDGLFRPEQNATRAEAAKLLYALMQQVLGQQVTPEPVVEHNGTYGGGGSTPSTEPTTTPEPTPQPCPCPDTTIPDDSSIIETWVVGPEGTVERGENASKTVTWWASDRTEFYRQVGINVPEGAVDTTTTIAIAFDPNPSTPEVGTLVSGILEYADMDSRNAKYGAFKLYKDNCYNFRLPITVTIPFLQEADDNDMPSVFYHQSSYDKFIAAGVKNIKIDTGAYDNGLYESQVSFTTVHDGTFSAVEIDGLWNKVFGTAAEYTITTNNGLDDYDTGFKVSDGIDGTGQYEGDSFDIANDLSKYWHGGNIYGGDSIGMVNYANWHFSLNPDTERPNLYKAYANGSNDAVEEELISRSFLASSNTWNNGFMINEHGEYGLSDEETMYQLIQAMLVTKMPQTLIKSYSPYGTGYPSALLVTGFNYYKNEGIEFHCYDPSYPTEQKILNYSFGSGDAWSNLDYFDDKYYYEGFSSSVEPEQLETLYYGAENEWPTDTSNAASNFSKIELTTTEETDEEEQITIVHIKGKVTGGASKANYIVCNVDGLDGADHDGEVNYNDGLAYKLTGPNNDEFDLTINVSLWRNHSIMLYATCLKGAAIDRCAKPLSAFEEIVIEGSYDF